MRKPAVQGTAQAGDPLLGIHRGDERQRLLEPGCAAALRCAEEARQLGSGTPLAQVQEQRDAPGHLPIVVEVTRRLELRHLPFAVERRRARFAEHLGYRTARGVLGDGVIARAGIEEHAVHVEDERLDAGPAHSSALSARRNASFAAGGPILTRSAL